MTKEEKRDRYNERMRARQRARQRAKQTGAGKPTRKTVVTRLAEQALTHSAPSAAPPNET